MSVPIDKRIHIADIEDLILSESLKEEPYAMVRSESKSCSCSECANLCTNLPGFFEPLGFMYYLITMANSEDPMVVFSCFEKIIDDLQKDFYSGDLSNGEIQMLRPRTIKEKSGEKVRFNLYAIQGECVYLSKSGCMLSNETRPSECRCAYRCKTPQYKFLKPQMAEQWDSPLGRAIISLYDSVGKRRYGDSFQKGMNINEDGLSFMLSSLMKM